MKDRTSTHARLYRALTRLAPRAHRARFRDEQCTLFADLLAQGVPARTLWRRALPDLVRVWATSPRTSLVAFATQLAGAAARVGAATAAALEPATGVLPTRAPEVERARVLLLALLADRGGRRGQALVDAVAQQDPRIGRDAVWRALVDLQDARLVRDDPLWGYGQVDYRMRTHYHLTPSGAAAAAAPPDGTTVTHDTPS